MFRQYFSSLVIYDALRREHKLKEKAREWDLLINWQPCPIVNNKEKAHPLFKLHHDK